MPVRSEYQNLYPSDDKIENGLLVLLLVCGGEHNAVVARHTYEPLADFLKLSGDARDISRSEYYTNDASEILAWHNKVQWARRKLKDYGYLKQSPRGVWRLSEGGIKKAERLLKFLPPAAIGKLK